ncbi:MFS transporter [Paraburkholderia bannensis]|uniref:MFS transporter n=1 Tax=Paraburkholderia bannensis TaxID=765414 RepID=UPI002AC32FF9|nr:MFS transporter [Paraburkholderia bannensis]
MTSICHVKIHSSQLIWQQRATRASFFTAGFSIAAWAPLVPFVKSKLDINEATLGCLLLCLGLGSIFAMISAGTVVAKFGCRRVIVASAVAAAVTLSLLGSVSGVYATGLVLALFGAANGTLDVAINVHAIAVESTAGRRMMSGFHALYSIGGVAGAGLTALALSLGLAPGATAVMAALILITTLAMFGRHFRNERSKNHAASLALPHGTVLLTGAMCLMLMLVEGAMLDWSALFLSGFKQMPTTHSGIGYAAFASAMTVMRLTGDWTSAKFGARQVVRWGSAIGAAGVIVAILSPSASLSILGFAIMGVGCANVVPILYSVSGAQKAMPPEHAIAATATLGYAGTLTGPAGIGFIAHSVGLPVAFGILAALLAVVSFGSNIVPKREHTDALS